MKKLLIGVAFGALLLPAAALAQDQGHACLDESCATVGLFQTAAPEGSTGFQGTEAPSYGTWGFDLAGRDTTANPGDSFMEYANGNALKALTDSRETLVFYESPRRLDDTLAAMAELWGDRQAAVALIDDHEATLKYFNRDGSTVRLDPANAAHSPQIYAAHQVAVQGRLAGLLRRYN